MFRPAGPELIDTSKAYSCTLWSDEEPLQSTKIAACPSITVQVKEVGATWAALPFCAKHMTARQVALCLM